MSNEDLIAAGFEQLDENVLELRRPPKIQWGRLYQGQDDSEKIAYLEKLAASMNHAASLVQSQRDELAELCSNKELQLESLTEAMRMNNEILQSQVTQMNEQRQGFNSEVARLNKIIRELEA